MEKQSKRWFVFSVLLVFSFLFVSCEMKSLPSPQGLTADFFELFWEPVENADEYVVSIDGEEYITNDACFKLYEYATPGETYNLKVKAVKKDIVSNVSGWAEIIYEAEPVTPNLRYTVNENDDTCKVACPVESIPEDGKLVLPDEYEGRTVTVFETAEIAPSISIDSPGGVGLSSEYSGASYEGIKKVRLPAELKKMDKGALYKSQVNDVYIPNTVEEVAGFTECKNLTKITLPENLKAVGRYAFYNCTSLEKIEIPQSVRDIWFYAFYGCESLREISIPSGVTRITANSFYNCKSLTEIKIPEGVTEIESRAFFGCENLSSVDISDSIQFVEGEAFHKTKIYNDYPNGVVFIDNVLYACKGVIPENSMLEIPDTFKAIADNAVFKNQYNLISITLPDGLIGLPDETFSGCKNLVSVSLGEGISVIGKSAFENCESLKSYNIPDGVTLVGESAFSGCISITSAIIPDSVTSIGNLSFAYCKSLTEVELGSGLKSINKYAFGGCSNLESLKVPQGVTSLHLNSIISTNVSHLDLPVSCSVIRGTLENLRSVFIPKGEDTLMYVDFYLCPNLNTFYYGGTKEDWDNIKIYRNYYTFTMESHEIVEKENAKIAEWESKLTVYFYSEEAPTEEGNFWHYVDGTPTKW